MALYGISGVWELYQQHLYLRIEQGAEAWIGLRLRRLVTLCPVSRRGDVIITLIWNYAQEIT